MGPESGYQGVSLRFSGCLVIWLKMNNGVVPSASRQNSRAAATIILPQKRRLVGSLPARSQVKEIALYLYCIVLVVVIVDFE